MEKTQQCLKKGGIMVPESFCKCIYVDGSIFPTKIQTLVDILPTFKALTSVEFDVWRVWQDKVLVLNIFT